MFERWSFATSWRSVGLLLLLGLAGLGIGGVMWTNLLLLDCPLPLQWTDRQNDLSRLILAVARLEYAVDQVAMEPSTPHRNELTLATDALSEQVSAFGRHHVAQMPAAKPSLDDLQAVLQLLDNITIIFEDFELQNRVRDRLLLAQHDLNHVYYEHNQKASGNQTSRRHQVSELRMGLLVLAGIFLSLLVWLAWVLLRGRGKQEDMVLSPAELPTGHKLRTALNALLGMVQLLIKTDLTYQQKYYVDGMVRAGEQLMIFLGLETVDLAAGDEPVSPLAILVVEDDAISAQVLRQLLQGDGHRVTVVHRGQDALEELAWDQFQVVVMDLRMPDMDGAETTRQIRQRPEAWRAIPILILTADVSPEDEERCRQAGANQVLAKPVSHSRLRQVLAQEVPMAVPVQEEERSMVDETFLLRLHQAMGAESLQQLVDRLLEQTREGEQVLRAGETALRAWSHKLRGGAAFLGLRAVQELAAQLEWMALAPEKDQDQVAHLVAQLVAVAEASREEVRQWLAG